ncbi:non-specific lipid transfer protein GPI-anchored 5-like [Phragmites australis]|uniref:non-specific lipid transfer protein GPI-anchored 5-like n=1 Tax=Phragmites australis TaxID=29695 RepID=UPI002D767C79|nr:non-specific lipid transfer protein GPI-anchored 5-like [Phragmites australis]
MARRWLEVSLALVLAAATLSSAQTTVQPLMPSCPPAPLSLSPCIGYVFGVGSATLNSCCSQLRTFLQAQAPCLCAASKLAPSPVGLFLGQAQAMIPNVCNLPNPCDDATGASTAPAASTPSGAGSSSPATTPLAPTGQVPSAATTAPSATPAATTPATSEPTNTPAADPDTSGAPPAPDEDSPAVATAPGQATPAGDGSKLPELLHAAGSRSSRGTAAGTVLITVFLASVATISV